MPIFYKKQSDGTIDQVDLPAAEKARAEASGWSMSKPPVDEPPAGGTASDMPAQVGPDVVNTDYFNNLLDFTEQGYKQERGTAETKYNTTVDQLKASQKLFNAELSSDYGKALENLNITVTNRGVQDSGIYGRAITDLSKVKEGNAYKQTVANQDKLLAAEQEKANTLATSALNESKSKLSIGRQASSPYTNYSYNQS